MPSSARAGCLALAPVGSLNEAARACRVQRVYLAVVMGRNAVSMRQHARAEFSSGNIEQGDPVVVVSMRQHARAEFSEARRRELTNYDRVSMRQHARAEFSGLDMVFFPPFRHCLNEAARACRVQHEYHATMIYLLSSQ